MTIETWLRGIGQQTYAKSFADHSIDFDIIDRLSDDDLRELGVNKIGDRKRILAAIERLGPQITNTAPALSDALLQASERRYVTVLFIDLANYTQLSSSMDPEELQQLVNRFYAISDAIIEQHGGYVDKHLGDGILAIFGAPKAVGDEANRAVRVALAVRQAVVEMGEAQGVIYEIHAGLASGEVVAGYVGDLKNNEYTVLGDPVNLASRLESLAKSSEILMDGNTQQHVATGIDTSALGAKSIKGISDPVEVWRINGLFSRATQTPKGRFFIGRNAEILRFKKHLKSTSDSGSSGLVIIQGDAGIGKSALIQCFNELAETRGWRTIFSRSLDFGGANELNPIGILVSALIDLLGFEADTLEDAVLKAKIDTGILASDIPFIRDLLLRSQTDDYADVYASLTKSERARGKACALERLLISAARSQPLMFVIEDYHWSDPETRAYVDHLIACSASLPLLLVISTRNSSDIEVLCQSIERTDTAAVFMLHGLSETESEQLAKLLAQDFRGDPREFLQRSQGNPLFLEQLVLHAGTDNSPSLPPSLQSLLLVRIDKLDQQSKALLQAASIFGQRFTQEGVAFLLDQTDLAMDKLISEKLVYAEGMAFYFDHALIQESVYQSLLKRLRRELHIKAAQWFESRDLRLVAEHLDRADSPAASDAFLASARDLRNKFQHELALTLCERGLKRVKSAQTQFELLIEKGELLIELGQVDPAHHCFSKAATFAHDSRAQYRVHLCNALGYRMVDRYTEALSHLDCAYDIAKSQGWNSEIALVHHHRGNIYFSLGRIDECETENLLAHNLASQVHNLSLQANALSGLGDASYVSGKMNTALNYFNQCVEIATQHRLPRIEISNRVMIGFACLYDLEFEKAITIALRCAEEAHDTHMQRAEAIAHTLATIAYLELGQYTDAKAHARQALKASMALNAPRFIAQSKMYLGEVNRLLGFYAQAVALQEEAWLICEQTGMGFVGAHICAERAALCDKWDEALKFIEQGEALLAAGSVAHNHLAFYPIAADVALLHKQTEKAQGLMQAFEAYSAVEPLAWSRFHIARIKTQILGTDQLESENQIVEVKKLIAAKGIKRYSYPVAL